MHGVSCSGRGPSNAIGHGVTGAFDIPVFDSSDVAGDTLCSAKGDETMQRKVWAVALILLGVVLAGYFFLMRQAEVPPPPPPPQEVAAAPVEAPPPPAVPTEPVILNPVEPPPEAEPLPELGDSDAVILKALGDLLGKKAMGLLLTDEVIHNLVVTIDNLPRKHLPASIVPLKRAKGAFVTSGTGDALAIDARNQARYAPYAQLAKAISPDRLVALYVRFYPLFQRAYVEIGYPQGYFNDRLVVAIDDLLAAPELAEPVRLVQPEILYAFADPDLEARSAGQKIMMRIGRENAATIKARLREIRRLVARVPLEPTEAGAGS